MAWFGLHHSEKLPQVIINLLVVLDLTIRNNQNLGPGVNELLQFGDKFGKKIFSTSKGCFLSRGEIYCNHHLWKLVMASRENENIG